MKTWKEILSIEGSETMPLNKAGPRRRTIDTPDKSPRTQPVPKNSRPRFSQKAKLLPGIVLINRKPSLRKFYVYCSRREPGTHFPTFPARVTEHSKRTIRHAAPLKSHVGPPWGKSLSPSSPFARHVFQRTNAPLRNGSASVIGRPSAKFFEKFVTAKRERGEEAWRRDWRVLRKRLDFTLVTSGAAIKAT